MANNNVYSNAKIIKPNQNNQVQDYELGTFSGTKSANQNQQMQDVSKLNENEINGNVDPVLTELRNLQAQIATLNSKVTNIENDGVSGRDIDRQVVEAIKDLKHYASFFEQATFQMETKIIKTSMSIAKKIIGIEVGENSAAIAKETIINLLHKIKTASKISIHLNPKDYVLLKDELNLESFIELYEDINVTAGGVVIASDMGNFDGNIESKVNSMLESLDHVI